MDGRVQIWQRIHVTLNYWLLSPPPLALKAFLQAPLKKYIFFFLSPTLMAQSAWKNCSHKLFIVILHLRTLMPLIGLLWLTNCIFLSLFLFFFFFPSGVCFSSFPPRCGVTLSLSLSGCSLVSLQCTFFAVPPLLPPSLLPSPPRQWAFDWIHYLSCCSVCCCFSNQEKEMNY